MNQTRRSFHTMRLLLFDIDGTLINVSGIGRQMIGAALKEVFGTPGPINEYNFAGKTDLAIITDLMTTVGFSGDEISNRLPEVFKQMTVIGESIFSDEGLNPCPGVPILLEQLRNRTDCLLGLQTGNIAATAPLKLAAAGLDPTAFRLGAYGSDSLDRVGLLPIAWAHAQKLSGHSFNSRQTVIIGDTPADINCAREHGAISVAVATGTFSLAKLAGYSPDYLLEDLSDTPFVLDCLFS